MFFFLILGPVSTNKQTKTNKVSSLFVCFCCYVVIFFLFISFFASFLEKNGETEKFDLKERTGGITTRDITNTDISTMSELEFRTTIIKILARCEKKA